MTIKGSPNTGLILLPATSPTRFGTTWRSYGKSFKQPYSPSNKLTFKVNVADIINQVYVPRYYWDNPNQTLRQPDGVEPLLVSRLLEENVIEAHKGHGSPESIYKGQGDIPYIRVADIVNWELYRNPTSYVPRHVFDRIRGKDGVVLQQEDIIFRQARELPYRNGGNGLAIRQRRSPDRGIKWFCV